MMCSALYTALLKAASSNKQATQQNSQSSLEVRIQEPEIGSFDPQNRSASAIALSEALCSIDEDNKHTAQIDDLLSLVRESVEKRIAATSLAEVEDVMDIIETYTDHIAFTEIGRSSLKVHFEINYI